VTREEVARAREAAEAEDALIEEIEEAFLQRFGVELRVNILPQIDVGFRAYIFFPSDADVAACREGPLEGQMREFLTQMLRALDDDDEDLLALEIDSHESVTRDFNESYFLRLRSGEVQERGRRKL
jgi:hypothetical protein